jgi:hypothetical protein
MIPGIHLRGIAALGLVLLASLAGGCLTTDAHHATPYYEHNGMWCGDFQIGFEEARVAVRGALAEMKMPISAEGLEHHGVFLDTKTPDNFEARVVIFPPGRHEGTRICIRISGFGTHRKICEHLLDEIARHVEMERHHYAPAAVPPPGAAQAVAPSQRSALQPSLPPQPVPVGQ